MGDQRYRSHQYDTSCIANLTKASRRWERRCHLPGLGRRKRSICWRSGEYSIEQVCYRNSPQRVQIYCSSKAAIRAFSDALRRELVNTRIRIITVDPGQVLTVRQPHIVVVGSNCKGCRSSMIFDTDSIKQKQTKSTRKYLIAE
jgi:NAD(P)-dependent dehydrogenase (short-subunit alcohol dehydrogenase family)